MLQQFIYPISVNQLSSEKTIFKPLWLEPAVGIGKNSQRHDLPPVLVKNSVKICEHPPGELPILISLNLHMDKNPPLFPIPKKDFDQPIGEASVAFFFREEIGQLFIQKLISLLQIQSGIQIRKKETAKILKQVFDNALPQHIRRSGRKRFHNDPQL